MTNLDDLEQNDWIFMLNSRWGWKNSRTRERKVWKMESLEREKEGQTAFGLFVKTICKLYLLQMHMLITLLVLLHCCKMGVRTQNKKIGYC